ncbi:MAG: hypothetical protein KJ057_00080 [Phycisphaerae bacterium]|nr:hypothetical protein [Planctomycetia bacterium]MCK6463236.1 PQQ-like beta-propeller repeat protein [Phycisphaerae bacterium]MCL4716856.1 hypothetical protein [Phycisphaerae bacterium]NUQ08473.1 hypothetical protein [Phycisphaerae bacterium]
MKTVKKVCACFVGLGLTVPLAAQEWTTTWWIDGWCSPESWANYFSLAVDPDGNVIDGATAGRCSSITTTRKIDGESGNRLWFNSYSYNNMWVDVLPIAVDPDTKDVYHGRIAAGWPWFLHLLQKLDGETGAIIWEQVYWLYSAVRPTQIIPHGGSLYVAYNSESSPLGAVRCFDAETGGMIWELGFGDLGLPGAVPVTFNIDQGPDAHWGLGFIAGTYMDGRKPAIWVMAIQLSDGSRRWLKTYVPETRYASVVVDPSLAVHDVTGNVYAVTTFKRFDGQQEYLVVHLRTTGDIQWTAPAKHPHQHGPLAIHFGDLVVAGHSPRTAAGDESLLDVVMYSAFNGSRKWETKINLMNAGHHSTVATGSGPRSFLQRNWKQEFALLTTAPGVGHINYPETKNPSTALIWLDAYGRQISTSTRLEVVGWTRNGWGEIVPFSTTPRALAVDLNGDAAFTALYQQYMVLPTAHAAKRSSPDVEMGDTLLTGQPYVRQPVARPWRVLKGETVSRGAFGWNSYLPCHSWWGWGINRLYDEELPRILLPSHGDWLYPVRNMYSGRCLLTLNQCFSGGFLDDLDDSGISPFVVMASSAWNRLAFGRDADETDSPWLDADPKTPRMFFAYAWWSVIHPAPVTNMRTAYSSFAGYPPPYRPVDRPQYYARPTSSGDATLEDTAANNILIVVGDDRAPDGRRVTHFYDDARRLYDTLVRYGHTNIEVYYCDGTPPPNPTDMPGVLPLPIHDMAEEYYIARSQWVHTNAQKFIWFSGNGGLSARFSGLLRLTAADGGGVDATISEELGPVVKRLYRPGDEVHPPRLRIGALNLPQNAGDLKAYVNDHLVADGIRNPGGEYVFDAALFKNNENTIRFVCDNDGGGTVEVGEFEILIEGHKGGAKTREVHAHGGPIPVP